ncbi:MAG: PHP domain-containing protein [Clostridium sp.]|uniref:PHP domain-containing protein n=1 Tax=Clostridium sp. TaxID=1506 RepID=UPI003F3B2B6D
MYNIHTHTELSNTKNKDSINKLDKVVRTAIAKGLKGIAITEHEWLGGHLAIEKYKKANELNGFKIMLGNEIYLINDKETPRHFHFILVAKDEIGHRQLRRLSTKAWVEGWQDGFQFRNSTYKSFLEEVVNEDKGHLIASTACLGSEIAYHILNGDIYKAKEFIKWCQGLFGDDFYLELQPNFEGEQTRVNEVILQLARELNINYVITTDAHYPTKEDAKSHEQFLKSRNAEREVASFYATTYLMSEEELLEFFPQTIIDEANRTSQEIADKVQEFSLMRKQVMPPAKIPTTYNLAHKLFNRGIQLNTEYIQKFFNSDYEVDKYYLTLLEEGFNRLKIEMTEERVLRVEAELKEIWLTSDILEDRVSQYFVVMKDLIDEIWKVSIVAPGRGSAPCYYTNYLLDITQVDAIKYNLPLGRFLSAKRASMPDKLNLVWVA